MLRTHNQFFNTNAIFGNLIMGIDVAIEEQDGHKAKETIIALKTALMGSLAGVGDSLFHVIWGTIFGSVAGTLAQNGSVVGCVIWIIANIALLFRSGSVATSRLQTRGQISDDLERQIIGLHQCRNRFRGHSDWCLDSLCGQSNCSFCL